MIRYEVLKDKPKQLLSLTGFTPEELSKLLPSFGILHIYPRSHPPPTADPSR